MKTIEELKQLNKEELNNLESDLWDYREKVKLVIELKRLQAIEKEELR